MEDPMETKMTWIEWLEDGFEKRVAIATENESCLLVLFRNDPNRYRNLIVTRD